MPVYVYRNLTTGETFELQQRITEDALTHDPKTGDPVRRVIQPVGIAFKGSGFYVNDSRAGSGTKTAAPVKSETGDTAAASKPASADTGTASPAAPAAASVPATKPAA